MRVYLPKKGASLNDMAAHERTRPFGQGTHIPVEQNTDEWLQLRMGAVPGRADLGFTGTVQGASFCSISIGVNKAVLPRWGWQYLCMQKHRFRGMAAVRSVFDGQPDTLKRDMPQFWLLATRFRTSQGQFEQMRPALLREHVDAATSGRLCNTDLQTLERLADEAFFQCDREPGQAEPDACRWGHVLEDLAFDLFVRLSGLKAIESGVWTIADVRGDGVLPRNYRVSPDGLVTSKRRYPGAPIREPTYESFDECLEIKCPLFTLPFLKPYDGFMADWWRSMGRTIRRGTVQIPMEYLTQMMYQMAVTGKPRCRYIMARFVSRPHAYTDDGRLVCVGPAPDGVDPADWESWTFQPPPDVTAQAADFSVDSVDPEPVEHIYAIVHWSRSFWEWMFPYMEAMRRCVALDIEPAWSPTAVKERDPPPPLRLEFPQLDSQTPQLVEQRRRKHLERLSAWHAARRQRFPRRSDELWHESRHEPGSGADKWRFKTGPDHGPIPTKPPTPSV